MQFKSFVFKLIRKIIRFFYRKKFYPPVSVVDRSISNQIIIDHLSSDKPFMLSRFGTTELITLTNYFFIKSENPLIFKLFIYLFDNIRLPWWEIEHFHYLKIFSGVFPSNKEVSEKFSEIYFNEIPKIDLLGSFQYYEKFMPLSDSCKMLHLETLYPFFVPNPWTSVLKGKKVLVIHPFDNSIKLQYNNRRKLFDNNCILPDFELITLKAIQSAGGENSYFNDWFSALEYMKNQIKEIEFDVCLIGCGAYGLPLASFVKDLGKQSLHMGGGLQLLFGIKGKRWDNPNYGKPQYDNFPDLMKYSYNSLYNEYWIRPLPEDTPLTKNNLDNGIYW